MLASPKAKAAEAATMGDGGAAANVPTDGFDPTVVANNIFNPQNRSNGNDPIYTPWIPAAIAGLTGFDLGIRTTEPANVAIEITMQIQDLEGNRFVAADSTDPRLGRPPKTLKPPGAR
jgi:hypothetical protein